MNQIHKNLPPIHLPFFTVFDWIILIFLLATAGFVLWKMLYRPEKEVKPVSPVQTKKFTPPSFSVDKALAKLKKEAEKGDWKNFSLLATKTLKTQCEIKFKKPFAFATGKEMEEILKEDLSPQELHLIHRFFSLLDPIKFAHRSGQKEMADEILNILKTFK